MAPFEILYGQLCRSPLSWINNGVTSAFSPDLFQGMTEKIEVVWKMFLTTQETLEVLYKLLEKRSILGHSRPPIS